MSAASPPHQYRPCMFCCAATSLKRKIVSLLDRMTHVLQAVVFNVRRVLSRPGIREAAERLSPTPRAPSDTASGLLPPGRVNTLS